jgi:hypothetical protein
MGFTSDEDFASTMIKPEGLKQGFTTEKDYGAPTNDANLNVAKSRGRMSSFGTGVGYGTKQIKNALEEAYLKFVGTDQEREDLQKEIAHEKDVYGRVTSKWNPNAGYMKGGNTAAQVGFGMALPTAQSKTMGARAFVVTQWFVKVLNLVSVILQTPIPQPYLNLARTCWLIPRWAQQSSPMISLVSNA